jgi:hypothetical protein
VPFRSRVIPGLLSVEWRNMEPFSGWRSRWRNDATPAEVPAME